MFFIIFSNLFPSLRNEKFSVHIAGRVMNWPDSTGGNERQKRKQRRKSIGG